MAAGTAALQQHLSKRRFIDNAHAELFRLLELAPGCVTRQHVVRFFAHAPADLSASLDNHLCDFLARLTQRASDNPCRSGKRRTGRLRAPRLDLRTDAEFLEPLDNFSVLFLLKKLMDASRHNLAHIRDPL